MEQLHVLLIIDNFNVTATQGQFLDVMPVFLLAEVYTHDIKLKKRIHKYVENYPELCQLTDDDGQGALWFEIDKRRISIRLTAPYTDDWRKAVSKLKKEESLAAKILLHGRMLIQEYFYPSQYILSGIFYIREYLGITC